MTPMTVHLLLVSQSDNLLQLVGEFAKGLGCTLEAAPATGRGLRLQLAEGADTLLNLLTFVALSATRLCVRLDEPTCEVTYRQGNAASVVTLALRIADFRLDTPTATR